jgi:hypothetical protein
MMDRLSGAWHDEARDRIAEIGEILALGLIRLRSRQYKPPLPASRSFAPKLEFPACRDPELGRESRAKSNGAPLVI